MSRPFILDDGVPIVRRTSARKSLSTSRTTRWKMSAESIWCSMSSAATSEGGPQVWFEPEERLERVGTNYDLCFNFLDHTGLLL
ncbi:hypothetical protein [Nocardia sp. CA-120079]|uniref:hypothetical protein n=1 Tax=Nocardia sp. CA-120079 TaxID=3239974 RepID=UPI003D960B54